MTPAPPPRSKDDTVDVNDVLSDAPESEALDTDNLDADFEQELEDLFSDDLEEEDAAIAEAHETDDEPIVLDDFVTVEDNGNVIEDNVVFGDSDDADDVDDDMLVLDEVADEGGDEDLMVLDDMVEDDGEDLLVLDDVAEDDGEDLLVLDDVAEDDGEDLLVLDDVVEAAPDGDDVAALVDDIAEDNLLEAEPEPVADEEAIELDDLLDEGGDEDVADLDDLLAESAAEADNEVDADDIDALLLDEVVAEEPAEPEVDDLPGDDLLEAVADESLAEDLVEEISFEDEDAVDAAFAEEGTPDVPVEEAVPADEIDLLMDAPDEPDEPDMPAEDDLFTEPGAESDEDSELDLAELAGVDRLDEDDAMENMESLLDNVEVDVTGIVDDSDDEDDDNDFDVPDLDMDDVAAGSLSDMITAEAMPPDAGLDVSGDVDVDQLLADVRTETSASAVAELQAKVITLEARVEELEHRLREEIADMVPAEAARIIREEIAALARELDD